MSGHGHKSLLANRITRRREQIVKKTVLKMMDEFGYDVQLTYKKKAVFVFLRYHYLPPERFAGISEEQLTKVLERGIYI